MRIVCAWCAPTTSSASSLSQCSPTRPTRASTTTRSRATAARQLRTEGAAPKHRNGEALLDKQMRKVVAIAGHIESEYALIVHEEADDAPLTALLLDTIGREVMRKEVAFADASMFVVTPQFVVVASKFILFYFQHSLSRSSWS